MPFFPQTKNLKQLGYRFTTVVEYGLSVRAGTPEPIRKKLEDTLRSVVNDPDVKDKLTQVGLTPRFVDGKGYEKIVTEVVRSVPDLIYLQQGCPSPDCPTRLGASEIRGQDAEPGWR